MRRALRLHERYAASHRLDVGPGSRHTLMPPARRCCRYSSPQHCTRKLRRRGTYSAGKKETPRKGQEKESQEWQVSRRCSAGRGDETAGCQRLAFHQHQLRPRQAAATPLLPHLGWSPGPDVRARPPTGVQRAAGLACAAVGRQRGHGGQGGTERGRLSAAATGTHAAKSLGEPAAPATGAAAPQGPRNTSTHHPTHQPTSLPCDTSITSSCRPCSRGQPARQAWLVHGGTLRHGGLSSTLPPSLSRSAHRSLRHTSAPPTPHTCQPRSLTCITSTGPPILGTSLKLG